MVIILLCFIVTFCALNSDVYPASHIFPIEKCEKCVRLGMMWASHAYSGKAEKYSRHGLLDCTVCPFGHPTLMGGPIFVDGRCGASTYK